jgi:hypothetical protein
MEGAQGSCPDRPARFSISRPAPRSPSHRLLARPPSPPFAQAAGSAERIVAVSAGLEHSGLLTSAGRVLLAGRNADGECGRPPGAARAGVPAVAAWAEAALPEGAGPAAALALGWRNTVRAGRRRQAGSSRAQQRRWRPRANGIWESFRAPPTRAPHGIPTNAPGRPSSQPPAAFLWPATTLPASARRLAAAARRPRHRRARLPTPAPTRAGTASRGATRGRRAAAAGRRTRSSARRWAAAACTR